MRAAPVLEIAEDLISRPRGIELDVGSFNETGVLFTIGQARLQTGEVHQLFHHVARLAALAIELRREAFDIGGLADVHMALLEEVVELVQGKASLYRSGIELVLINFCQQMIAGRVAHLELAVMLIGVNFLRRDITRLSMHIVANLKTLLQSAAFAQEIRHDFSRDVGGQISAQALLESLVYHRRNRCLRIHTVQIAGVVRDDSDLLMSQSPRGLGRLLGAVEPHILCNDPAVVGQDAVVQRDKVLRVQRGR